MVVMIGPDFIIRQDFGVRRHGNPGTLERLRAPAKAPGPPCRLPAARRRAIMVDHAFGHPSPDSPIPMSTPINRREYIVSGAAAAATALVERGPAR